MEEFQLAHHKVATGDKKYLIAILLESLEIDEPAKRSADVCSDLHLHRCYKASKEY